MHAATLTRHLRWNRYTEKEAKEHLHALNLVCIKTKSQRNATEELCGRIMVFAERHILSRGG